MKRSIILSLLGLVVGMSALAADGDLRFVWLDSLTGLALAPEGAGLRVDGRDALTGPGRAALSREGWLALSPEPGPHRVRASYAGCPDLVFTVVPDGVTRTFYLEFPVTDGSSLWKRTAARPGEGLISGHVTDDRGRPLGGARVGLDRLGLGAVTDGDGFFEVPVPRSDGKDGFLVDDLVAQAPGFGTLRLRGEFLEDGNFVHKRLVLRNAVEGALRDVAPEERYGGSYYLLHPALKTEESRQRCLRAKEEAEARPPGQAIQFPGAVLTDYTTIRVGTSCSCTSCTSVSVMTLQDYSARGIGDEWIGSWNLASLEAGTVAYRTYGAWHIDHPLNANYDICSTTCCQVYDPDTDTTNCATAAANTAGMAVLANTDNKPLRSEYSAENNYGGDSTGASNPCRVDCYTGHCISDSPCCGQAGFGHGRGMCQWGTKRWGDNSKTWQWMVSHYYTENTYITANHLGSLVADPVTRIAAKGTGAGSFQVKHNDNEGVTYKLKYSVNADLSGATAVTGTGGTFSVSGVTSGQTYYLRMYRVDGGSDVDESEVLAVTASAAKPVLVVNGYDRAKAANTRNFVPYHVSSILLAGYAVASCTNEALTDAGMGVALGDHVFTDWLQGEESSLDSTFTADEQAVVTAYLQNRGKLFVNGAEIAWDLEGYAGHPSAADTTFLHTVLKSQYASDDGGGSHTIAASGGTFANLPAFEFGTASAVYAVTYPDGLWGSSGGQVFLYYGGVDPNVYGAAGMCLRGNWGVSGNGAALVYLGFPFETVVGVTSRDRLMRRVSEYFFPWQGDFDGDGKKDLFWRNTADGANSIWHLDGVTYTASSALQSVGTGWKLAASGDFNGDGKTDLLWRDTASGANSVWFLDGVGVTSTSALMSVGAQWELAAAADFNRDGKPDLLWRNTGTGDNSVWFLDGVSVTSATALQGVSTTWKLAGAGDFNGDGRPDLFWRNTGTGANSIWYLNGVGVISTSAFQTVGTEWDLGAVGDFNGDGKPDVMWRNRVSGANAVWYLDGVAVTGTAPFVAVGTTWELSD